MTVNSFTFIGMYDHALAAAAHVLDKGWTFAASKGVSEREMLGWRLVEDMQPLAFQLGVVCNFPRQWAARVAGLPVPESAPTDLDVAGFQRAITGARDYLKSLKEEQFEGRDDVDLTYVIAEGMAPTLPCGRWLSTFATTNIYFHLSTAYDILRANGAPLGKADLFAGGI